MNKNNDLYMRLYGKSMNIDDFNYDYLQAPSIYNFLTIYDISSLYNIATSLRYSAAIRKKYKAIDDILKKRDFAKITAGTNRVVYFPKEYPDIVVKIPINKVALNDNPSELRNQWFIKPFCTKVFEVQGDGIIGTFERVRPILSRVEFKSIADDIFNLITKKIIGKYILDDIGTHYFMNYGIRDGFGAVILDFPFVYELDGEKIYCTKNDPYTGIRCNGEIDYDDGFNNLICTKCGKTYNALELEKRKENGIFLKRSNGNTKNIKIRRGDTILLQSKESNKYIE